VVAHGPAGRRTIPAEAFFRSQLTTARQPDEIVVEARFPVLAPDAGWAFDEMTRRHGDFAIAGVGAVVCLDAQRKAIKVQLAACGIGDRPVRLIKAERRLLGTRLAASDCAAAGAVAAAAVTAADDIHASASYRRRAVTTLVERMAAKAAARAEKRITP
jgi:carbon-monoxide dehydrogenase medium subunit